MPLWPMRWGQNDADGERGATQESEWHTGADPCTGTSARHHPPSQCSGLGGVVFSSCPIASIIRRQIASPAQLPASASSSARIALFYIRLVAVTFQHQVGDAPDVNFRDHA